MPVAAGSAAAAAQAPFALLLDYAALPATPGPNMLAIGGVAAARGFARAVPVCPGLAAGAGAHGGGGA